MSLYVKLERYACAPRILRLRGLSACIGEDYQGLIGCSNLKHRLFSLYAVGSRYLLKTEHPCLTLNAQPIATGTTIMLSGMETLQGLDTKFSFFPTSPAAELLAQENSAKAEEILQTEGLEKLAQLTFALGTASRTFALFTDLTVSIGSAEEDHIMVGIEGVKAAHCTICNQAGKITVKALNGEIGRSQETPTQQIEVSKDTPVEMRYFRLLPSGIELKITNPL